LLLHAWRNFFLKAPQKKVDKKMLMPIGNRWLIFVFLKLLHPLFQKIGFIAAGRPNRSA